MRTPSPTVSDQTDWTLSEFLNLLDLRGHTWCVVELRGRGGFSVPPNEGVLFYCVLQGTAYLTGLAGATIDLNTGEVRMVLSGEAHGVCAKVGSRMPMLEFLREYRDVEAPPSFVIGSGPTTARILCGKLKASWPSGLRRMSMPPVIKLGLDTLGADTTSARLEALQICAAGDGATAVLTRFAAMIFALVLRNHPHFPMLFRLSTASDPIAHALQLIASDPAAEWSVARLAHRVGMGRSNFAARFMVEVGRTPMDVITERRMQFAADLLRQGELKIGEVSARVGYHSEEAFSRRFTRFFGMAPSQMRQEAQKQRSGDKKRAVKNAVAAVPVADRSELS